MSDCQVIFYGELQPGQEDAIVRQKVAALFKASDKQIAAIFSGKRVVLKSGLARQKAEQYRMALAKVGAIAHIESTASAPKASKPSSSSPSVTPPSPAKSPIASKTDVEAASGKVEAAATEESAQTENEQDSSVAGDDVGRAVVRQVDPSKVGQLQSATLAPTGTTLGDEQDQPELSLDLSHMSLSAVGSNLQDNYDETPPKDIDISHLSLDQ